MEELKEALKLLDRNSLVEIEEFCRKRLAQAWRDMHVGDTVEFESRSGATIRGRLVKINRKSLKVQSKQNRDGREVPFHVTWSVSPSLTRLVEEA